MFIPETIDLGKSEKYDLVIRIKDDEFMFSITDSEKPDNRFISGTSLSQDSLLANVQRIVFDFNFLTQEYKSATVIFVTTEYSIVPDKYFNEKEKLDLYNSVCSEKAKFVLSCDNKEQSSKVIFPVDKELSEFLTRSLFNPQFIHHASSLIGLFAENEKNADSRMYVNYHSNLIDILCFSSNKLEHCVTYKDLDVRTQLYFILKMWEQSGLAQETDRLYITGDRPDMVDEVLKSYIQMIGHVDKFDSLFFPNLGGRQAPIDLLAL